MIPLDCIEKFLLSGNLNEHFGKSWSSLAEESMRVANSF